LRERLEKINEERKIVNPKDEGLSGVELEKER
jgi:hypothetical protein